jgi:hypothetical protein
MAPAPERHPQPLAGRAGMMFTGHVAQVWRPIRSRGTYGTMEPVYVEMGVPVVCDVQHRRQVQSALGPGDAPVGEWKVYLRLGPLVQADDIVQVTDGANAPRLLRVEDAYRPQGRHLELTCSAWHGREDEFGAS